MPRYIVKPDPARDEYVEWSAITDTPSAPFTRAEWLADFPLEGHRANRTDANGSSCLFKGESGWSLGWHETEFRMQDAAGGYFVTVPRRDLPDAARALARGEALNTRWPESPRPDDEETQ